jgi:hypothetical protein
MAKPVYNIFNLKMIKNYVFTDGLFILFVFRFDSVKDKVVTKIINYFVTGTTRHLSKQ